VKGPAESEKFVRSLQQEGANLIDDAGALTDQPLTHPVQGLQVELLDSLGGDKSHRWALQRLGDCLGIAEIILLSLRKRTHVFCRHQPGIVTETLELATEMMRTDAGLHADQARRHVGEPCFHLATRAFLPQRDCAALIETYDLKGVLADIDADHGDRSVEFRRHSVLLVFGAPCQRNLLAGQEHGRTIPLADFNVANRCVFLVTGDAFCGVVG
jgi:hypothetical protein